MGPALNYLESLNRFYLALAGAPSARYNQQIIAIRALAVSMVLAFHLNVDGLVGGYIGVDLFFVISGYLITQSLVVERTAEGRWALGKFYLRRITRLWPPLAIMVICFASFAFIAGVGVEIILREAMVALVHMGNWTRGFGLGYPDFLGHLWSLAVEEQFYLIWPALLVIFGARPSLAVTLLLLVILWRGIFFHVFDASAFRVYNGLDTHSDALLIGAFLGLIGPKRLAQIPRAIAGMGEAAAFAYILWFGWQVHYDDAWLYDYGLIGAWFAGSALVISSLTGARFILYYLSQLSPVRVIGNLAYSLYLFHVPVILILSRQYKIYNWPLYISAVAISLILAGLVFTFIELPFLTRRRAR